MQSRNIERKQRSDRFREDRGARKRKDRKRNSRERKDLREFKLSMATAEV